MNWLSCSTRLHQQDNREPNQGKTQQQTRCDKKDATHRGGQNGPKAHPMKRRGKTATVRRQPQPGTDTRPNQSAQNLTVGQARLQAGTQGYRGNRQEHIRYCKQKQIKMDEGPEGHRGKETAQSPDSDDQKTHPRALKTGGKSTINFKTEGKGYRPRHRGNRKSRNETS